MEERPNYYSILPASVRYDERLKANEKLMYSEITALSNKNGCCWASNQYFAELYRVSKQTISLWINKLAKCGYINVEMQYKKGTKQIEKRVIYLAPYSEKSEYPYSEKIGYPIKKNPKDNITSINNKTYSASSKNNAQNKQNKQSKQSTDNYESDFNEMWQLYPNKKGKKQAYNHYRAWRKQSKNNNNDYLKTKLNEYQQELAKNDWQHAMYGSTWFNGRFDDEYTNTISESQLDEQQVIRHNKAIERAKRFEERERKRMNG